MKICFWLSFANEETFAGVVIVDLSADEIGTDEKYVAAIRKTIRLKINPGPEFEVLMHRIRPDDVPEQFKHRLLSTSEAEMLNLRTQ